MNLSDIAIARLSSQQIAATKFTKVKELVSYMAAVQAQDYAMSKYAIGLRLPGSTEKKIEEALDKGEILRTHVLRPTWHIIPAEDIYWMLALGADKIKALMKTMDRQLELTEKIYTKSNKVIEKILGAGKHITREKIGIGLEKAGISIQKNRLSHLLIRTELEGIACSGKMEGDKRTYALLPERVPKRKMPGKEESLALLAKKYFISRGPATAEDFSWWSGVNLTNARQGLEMVKSGLNSEKINGLTYWFGDDLKTPVKRKTTVHLLPAYDEFIISYKDRTAALAMEHHKKVLGINGIFNPVIIVNGQVTGLWKRSFQKDKIIIETKFFTPHNNAVQLLAEEKGKLLGRFLKMKTEISHSTY